MHLIDTNVAIELRDLRSEITERVEGLPAVPKLSLLSWVELEAGVYRDPVHAPDRRNRLDELIAALEIVPFDANVVRIYGRIVAACGFSRPRILDRLIAATAIASDLTLITINAADFRDIPNLKLEAWPAPQ